MILLFLVLLISVVQGQVFMNEPFLVEINSPTTLNCVSSLDERNGLPMFAVDGTSYLSFNATSPLNITFLYSGTQTLTLTDISTLNVSYQNVTVYPREIALGSVLSVIDDADLELATYVMIDHVNNYLNILPNTTLVFRPKRVDACSPTDAVRKVMEHMTDPNPPQVIFGPSCSVQCTAASILAGTSEIPVISYLAAGDFPNADVYPYFMRTQVFTTARVADTMMDFIRRMGYTRLAVIQMDIFQFAPSFFSDASSAGIDVAVKATIPTGQTSFVDEIKSVRDSGARVIAVSLFDSSSDYPEQQLVYKEAIKQGIMGPDSGYIWVTFNLPFFSENGLWPNMTSYVNGSFSCSVPETYAMPEERQDMIDRWNNITTYYAPQNDYWYTNSRPNDEKTLFSYNYGMCSPVNAVLNVAHALQKLIYIDQVEYTGQTLIQTMKSINFVGPCGPVQFNRDGEFLYNLSIANYIYPSPPGDENPPLVNENDFDDNFGMPTIPMSINLSTVLISGQEQYGKWEPDFQCVGGCGNGTCLGPNDCQCHRGFSKLDTSTTMMSSGCIQKYDFQDDSIVLRLSPTFKFLLTRAYERAVAQAVAQSLNVNITQIETIDYTSQDDNIIYEFVLYADLNQSTVTLESDLVVAMNRLQNNFVQLLSSSSSQTVIVTKDWLNYKEPLGITFLTILSLFALAWIVTVIMAIQLFNLPFRGTKLTQTRSRGMAFSWSMNGTVLLGIALALGTAAIHINQPTNWTCRAQPWTLFLALSLIMNVKVAKLYRLHSIFNNPQLKRVQLPDSRLMVLFVMPGTFITLITLIIGELNGSPKALLETSANLMRQRSWICHYPVPAYANGVSLALLLIHILTAAAGLILRFLVRHVQATHLDNFYAEVLMIFTLPFVMGPLWYNARANVAVAPRLESIFAVIWMILVVFASLIIQHFYKFMRVFILGDAAVISTLYSANRAKSNTTESVMSHSGTIKMQARLNVDAAPLLTGTTYGWVDTNQVQIQIEAALIGRFFSSNWRKYDVKYFNLNRSGRIQHLFGLFHASPPKDWSGILFTDSNILDMTEVDPTKFLLRVFIKQGDSYFLRAKDASEYALLRSTLKSISGSSNDGSQVKDLSTNNLLQSTTQAVSVQSKSNDVK